MLQNVMIGGTIEGAARLLESLFSLPRHRRDERRLTAQAMQALRLVGLEALAGVRADRLQHSELRFMEIARALMLHPAFLLLDEPAAGLSAEEIRRLGELIMADQPAGHRRAAGRAPCRPDLRHLRPRDRAEPRQGTGRRARRPKSARTRRWSVPISAAEPLLAVRGLTRRLRQDRHPARRRPDDRRRARSSPCSAPTAPARPRCCAPCPGCCRGAARLASAGADLAGVTPREAARRGLVHVVEGHRVFTQLSVTDNLLLAGYDLPRGERAGARRGGAGVLPRDRSQAARPRRRAVRRSAADAGGGAGPGAPAAPADAGRAVRRPVAGAGGSRAGGGGDSCATRGTAVLLVEQLIEKALRWPTGCTRWRAARSCWKPRPTSPTSRQAGAGVFRPRRQGAAGLILATGFAVAAVRHGSAARPVRVPARLRPPAPRR